MRNIDDLEHFVLAEGETLILRCKRNLADDELAYMRKCIERFLPGRPVLVLPPDIEVCAGKLEVWGAEDEARAEADAQTQEQLRRDEVERAYHDNRVIWAREDGDVFMAHKHNTPLTSFRWDEPGVNYGLTRKEVCD